MQKSDALNEPLRPSEKESVVQMILKSEIMKEQQTAAREKKRRVVNPEFRRNERSADAVRKTTRRVENREFRLSERAATALREKKLLGWAFLFINLFYTMCNVAQVEPSNHAVQSHIFVFLGEMQRIAFHLMLSSCVCVCVCVCVRNGGGKTL